MFLQFNNKQKGVTFIEMLVYLAVFTVIFFILTSFIVWTYRANTKAIAMRNVENNAQRAMQIILKEIRQAKSIYTPTVSESQLSLETTVDLPAGETSTYADFFLCGTQICLKRESQEVFALTSNKVKVSNLEFVQFESSTIIPHVQVSFLVNYIDPNIEAFVNATSSAVLRSH